MPVLGHDEAVNISQSPLTNVTLNAAAIEVQPGLF